jgi:hypothetical protein
MQRGWSSSDWWRTKDDDWSDFWVHGKTPPYAARVVVKRLVGDFLVETSAVAHWAEYAVTGPAGQMWANMPANQLAKCAEALALRKAFPNELSGMYTDDEMQQADHQRPVRKPGVDYTAVLAPVVEGSEA